MQVLNRERSGRGTGELDAPGVCQYGRRDAEADHIGQRVHFTAEIANGLSEARDAAVQAVEKNGNSDGDGCGAKMSVRGRGTLRVQLGVHDCAAERLHDGVEAQEHVACGEQSWQGVDGSPRTSVGRAGIDQPFLQPQSFHTTHTASIALASRMRAMTLEPALTRSPACTMISHSGPRNTSTRDPNLISPMRSPGSRISPAFL